MCPPVGRRVHRNFSSVLIKSALNRSSAADLPAAVDSAANLTSPMKEKKTVAWKINFNFKLKSWTLDEDEN